MSTSLSLTTPQGIPTRTTTAILQTTYGLSRLWSVGVRGGYTLGDFIGQSGFNNHGWLAGASFNYEIWRNLTLTLDYQYTTVQSDAPFSDFTRNSLQCRPGGARGLSRRRCGIIAEQFLRHREPPFPEPSTPKTRGLGIRCPAIEVGLRPLSRLRHRLAGPVSTAAGHRPSDEAARG